MSAAVYRLVIPGFPGPCWEQFDGQPGMEARADGKNARRARPGPRAVSRPGAPPDRRGRHRGINQTTNPVKGQLRRDLYELLERALQDAGITARHLEPHTDRGDGVLILIRPLDDVPKTLVLGRLMPILAALLVDAQRLGGLAGIAAAPEGRGPRW